MIVWLLVWLIIWLDGLLHRFNGNVKAPVDKCEVEVMGRLTHGKKIYKRFMDTGNVCQVSGQPSQKEFILTIEDEKLYCPEAVPGLIISLNKSDCEKTKLNYMSSDSSYGNFAENQLL